MPAELSEAFMPVITPLVSGTLKRAWSKTSLPFAPCVLVHPSFSHEPVTAFIAPVFGADNFPSEEGVPVAMPHSNDCMGREGPRYRLTLLYAWEGRGRGTG